MHHLDKIIADRVKKTVAVDLNRQLALKNEL